MIPKTLAYLGVAVLAFREFFGRRPQLVPLAS